MLLQQPLGLTKWTVTGGYIEKTETIEEAANRLVELRTGLKHLFLQQFRAFGNSGRIIDDEYNPANLSKIFGFEITQDFWIFDYFVSIGSYTLTEFSLLELKKGEIENDIQWWSVHSLPPLMFDHQLIIAEALKALRLHIAHYPIGYKLLSEKFTLPERHNLYQTILDKPLDDRNFTKRLLAAGVIEKLPETKKIGQHRSPFLYKFNREKHESLLKIGGDLAF